MSKPTHEVVHVDDLLDLLPIVSHLPWRYNRYGRIRARCLVGRQYIDVCPACAIVNEAIGHNSYAEMANAALQDFGVGIDGLEFFIDAADYHNGIRYLRERMVEILRPRHRGPA